MGARGGGGAECCFVLNGVPSVVRFRRDVRCASVSERRVASKARLLVRNLSTTARTFFGSRAARRSYSEYTESASDDQQLILKIFRQLAMLGKFFSLMILIAACLAVITIARTQAAYIFTATAAVLGALALHVVYQQLEFMMCSVASNALSSTLHTSRRPKRVFLVRHGESEGNVDRNLYRVLPDNKLQLTEKGRRQAFEAGRQLKEDVGDESILFYVSPYVRTKQTLEEILEGGAFKNYVVHENPHLREQEFGNFQDPDKFEHFRKEREACGWFYHRVPGGESGADLYTRSTLFLDSMFSDVDRYSKQSQAVDNVVIVSHGLTMRMLCMIYFNWTVDCLQHVRPPRNCDIWKMESAEDSNVYKLATEVSVEPLESSIKESKGLSVVSEPWTKGAWRRRSQHRGV